MDQNIASHLLRARDLIRAGDVNAARKLLVELLRQEPKLEQGWYLLSFVMEGNERKIYAIKQALAINPNNENAKSRLTKLTALVEKDKHPPEPEPEKKESAPDFSSLMSSMTSRQEKDGKTKKPSKWVRPVAMILLVIALTAVVIIFTGDSISSVLGGLSSDNEGVATEDLSQLPTGESGLIQLPPTWTPTPTITPTPTTRPSSTPPPTQSPTPLTAPDDATSNLYKDSGSLLSNYPNVSGYSVN